MIPDAAVEAAARVMYAQDSQQQDMGDFSLEVYQHDARSILEAAAPHMLADLTKNSPRLPSAVRNVVFEAVFDVVDKFNFPAQNCGTLPDVVEIGDVCGDVEKRILAILRASALERMTHGNH